MNYMFSIKLVLEDVLICLVIKIRNVYRFIMLIVILVFYLFGWLYCMGM